MTGMSHCDARLNGSIEGGSASLRGAQKFQTLSQLVAILLCVKSLGLHVYNENMYINCKSSKQEVSKLVSLILSLTGSRLQHENWNFNERRVGSDGRNNLDG